MANSGNGKILLTVSCIQPGVGWGVKKAERLAKQIEESHKSATEDRFLVRLLKSTLLLTTLQVALGIPKLGSTHARVMLLVQCFQIGV